MTQDRPAPDAFQARNADLTQRMAADPQVREATRAWVNAVLPYEYPYHFSWLGVPIIQFPSDIVVMQELMWEVKPDLVIETGVARGGSLVFYASMLELLGGNGNGGGNGRVVGVDITVSEHARAAVEGHRLRDRIGLIEGSSTDPGTVRAVAAEAAGRERVLVVLDSNHTHEHVAAELRMYAPMVTKGSYIVVFDTVIEELPDQFHVGRAWRPGSSPHSAVHEFLAGNDGFEIDRSYEERALVTVSPDGFLRRR